MRSSTIVVTYNHRRHIEQCLRTLLPTLSADDEVIVVDNASTDGTANYVATEFPGVRLVRNTHNPGFGAACNRGACESGAEVLVFLNPDTEPRPGWHDALIDALRTIPGAGLVTPKLLLRDTPELIDTFGHDVHISGIATCRGWGSPTDAFTQFEEVAAVSGACFAIPAELFSRLGGFDERLFLYYEDDDLSLRARLAGYRCLAIPGAVVLHDHASGISADKLRYLERNRWWSLLKVLEVRTLVGLAPTLIMSEIVAWGMAVHGGPRHLSAKLRAWRDLLSWLHLLHDPRLAVQRTRKISDAALLRRHTTRLPLAQVTNVPGSRAAERALAFAFRGALLLTTGFLGAMKWHRLGN